MAPPAPHHAPGARHAALHTGSSSVWHAGTVSGRGGGASANTHDASAPHVARPSNAVASGNSSSSSSYSTSLCSGTAATGAARRGLSCDGPVPSRWAAALRIDNRIPIEPVIPEDIVTPPPPSSQQQQQLFNRFSHHHGGHSAANAGGGARFAAAGRAGSSGLHESAVSGAKRNSSASRSFPPPASTPASGGLNGASRAQKQPRGAGSQPPGGGNGPSGFSCHMASTHQRNRVSGVSEGIPSSGAPDASVSARNGCGGTSSDGGSRPLVAFCCNVHVNLKGVGLRDTDSLHLTQFLEQRLSAVLGLPGEAEEDAVSSKTQSATAGAATVENGRSSGKGSNRSNAGPEEELEAGSRPQAASSGASKVSTVGSSIPASPNCVTSSSSSESSHRLVSGRATTALSTSPTRGTRQGDVKWFISNSRHVRLRVLKVYKNAIADGGALALAQLIGSQPSPLEELHLSHNRISQSGAEALFRSIAQAHTRGGRGNSGSAPVNNGTASSTIGSSLPPPYLYPRPDFGRQEFLPVWIRLEYNNIADAHALLQKWEAEVRSHRGIDDYNLRLACFADRPNHPHGSKDPHCSPARCLRSVAGHAPLLHLYSFYHQSAGAGGVTVPAGHSRGTKGRQHDVSVTAAKVSGHAGKAGLNGTVTAAHPGTTSVAPLPRKKNAGKQIQQQQQQQPSPLPQTQAQRSTGETVHSATVMPASSSFQHSLEGGTPIAHPVKQQYAAVVAGATGTTRPQRGAQPRSPHAARGGSTVPTAFPSRVSASKAKENGGTSTAVVPTGSSSSSGLPGASAWPAPSGSSGNKVAIQHGSGEPPIATTTEGIKNSNGGGGSLLSTSAATTVTSAAPGESPPLQQREQQTKGNEEVPLPPSCSPSGCGVFSLSKNTDVAGSQLDTCVPHKREGDQQKQQELDRSAMAGGFGSLGVRDHTALEMVDSAVVGIGKIQPRNGSSSSAALGHISGMCGKETAVRVATETVSTSTEDNNNRMLTLTRPRRSSTAEETVVPPGFSGTTSGRALETGVFSASNGQSQPHYYAEEAQVESKRADLSMPPDNSAETLRRHAFCEEACRLYGSGMRPSTADPGTKTGVVPAAISTKAPVGPGPQQEQQQDSATLYERKATSSLVNMEKQEQQQQQQQQQQRLADTSDAASTVSASVFHPAFLRTEIGAALYGSLAERLEEISLSTRIKLPPPPPFSMNGVPGDDEVPLYIFLDASAFAEMRRLWKNEQVNLFSFPGMYALYQKGAICHSTMDAFKRPNKAGGMVTYDVNFSVIVMVVNAVKEGLLSMTESQPFLRKTLTDLQQDFIDPLTEFGLVEMIDGLGASALWSLGGCTSLLLPFVAMMEQTNRLRKRKNSTVNVTSKPTEEAPPCCKNSTEDEGGTESPPLDAVKVIDFACVWSYHLRKVSLERNILPKCEPIDSYMINGRNGQPLPRQQAFSLFVTSNPKAENFFNYLLACQAGGVRFDPRTGFVADLQQLMKPTTPPARTQRSLNGNLLCLSLDRFNKILRQAYPSLAKMITQPGAFIPTRNTPIPTSDILCAPALRRLIRQDLTPHDVMLDTHYFLQVLSLARMEQLRESERVGSGAGTSRESLSSAARHGASSNASASAGGGSSNTASCFPARPPVFQDATTTTVATTRHPFGPPDENRASGLRSFERVDTGSAPHTSAAFCNSTPLFLLRDGFKSDAVPPTSVSGLKLTAAGSCEQLGNVTGAVREGCLFSELQPEQQASSSSSVAAQPPPAAVGAATGTCSYSGNGNVLGGLRGFPSEISSGTAGLFPKIPSHEKNYTGEDLSKGNTGLPQTPLFGKHSSYTLNKNGVEDTEEQPENRHREHFLSDRELSGASLLASMNGVDYERTVHDLTVGSCSDAVLHEFTETEVKRLRHANTHLREEVRRALVLVSEIVNSQMKLASQTGNSVAREFGPFGTGSRSDDYTFNGLSSPLLRHCQAECLHWHDILNHPRYRTDPPTTTSSLPPSSAPPSPPLTALAPHPPPSFLTTVQHQRCFSGSLASLSRRSISTGPLKQWERAGLGIRDSPNSVSEQRPEIEKEEEEHRPFVGAGSLSVIEGFRPLCSPSLVSGSLSASSTSDVSCSSSSSNGFADPFVGSGGTPASSSLARHEVQQGHHCCPSLWEQQRPARTGQACDNHASGQVASWLFSKQAKTQLSQSPALAPHQTMHCRENKRWHSGSKEERRISAMHGPPSAFSHHHQLCSPLESRQAFSPYLSSLRWSASTFLVRAGEGGSGGEYQALQHQEWASSACVSKDSSASRPFCSRSMNTF